MFSNFEVVVVDNSEDILVGNSERLHEGVLHVVVFVIEEVT